MTKSRIALIALAVCCVALLSAGTMAYFTMQATAYNVITTGYLDLTLHEKTTDGADPDTPLDDLPDFVDQEGVMPSQTISKIVYVENTGDQDLFARVRLTKKIVAEDGSELPHDVMTMIIDTDGWLRKEGDDEWYYCSKILAPGEKSTVLLREVHFAKEMDNEYQKSTATVLVEAQAVQAKHNGEDVLKAAGWPADAQ